MRVILFCGFLLSFTLLNASFTTRMHRPLTGSLISGSEFDDSDVFLMASEVTGENTEKPIVPQRLIPNNSIKIPIQNKADRYYVFQANFSERNETFDIVIDTGSYKMWIADISCPNCPHKLFNCTETNSSCQILSDEGSDSIRYGAGGVRGQKAKVNFTIDGGANITDFKIMLITQTIMSGCIEMPGFDCPKFDGIIGLAQFSSWEGADYPFLVGRMKEQGLIDRLVLSIHLSHYREQEDALSELAVGGYNPRLVDIETVKWYKSIDSYHWSVTLQKFTLGNISLLGGSNGIQAIFDTGSTFIVTPIRMFKEIVQAFKDNYNVTCYPLRENERIHTCEGDLSKLPPLVIAIKGDTYTIDSNRYVIDKTLYFMGVNREEINLGMIFQREVYMMLDYEEGLVGIAPAKNKVSGAQKDGLSAEESNTEKVRNEEHVMSTWKLALLLLGLLIVVASGIVLVLWRIRKDKKITENANQMTLPLSSR